VPEGARRADRVAPPPCRTPPPRGPCHPHNSLGCHLIGQVRASKPATVSTGKRANGVRRSKWAGASICGSLPYCNGT
jgi:hypothetical protein